MGSLSWGLEWNVILDVAAKLFLAAFLGVAVSFRRSPDRYQLNLIEAHAFLSTAAAILMIIIGGEIPRAIGLFAAASVIRYRYAIQNPRDAGTLIVCLGLGMACGLGMQGVAIVGAVFMIILAQLVRLFPEMAPFSIVKQSEEIILQIQTKDYKATMEKIQTRFEQLGLDYALTSFERKFGERKGETTEIDLHLKYPANLDLQELSESLMDENILRLSWNDLPTRFG